MNTRKLLLIACITAWLTFAPAAGAQTPGLDLEGTGSLASSGACSMTVCPGVFNGSVTGPPVGSTAVNFNLNLSVNPSSRNLFTACYAAVGEGAVGASLSVQFVGEFCPGFGSFTLNGNVEISTSNLCASVWQASSGQLAAFGQAHTIGPTPIPTPKPRKGHPPGNPIPSVANAVISIVGTTAQLPAPCPSP